MKCSMCKGKKTILFSLSDDFGSLNETVCPKCKGTGEIIPMVMVTHSELTKEQEIEKLEKVLSKFTIYSSRNQIATGFYDAGYRLPVKDGERRERIAKFVKTYVGKLIPMLPAILNQGQECIDLTERLIDQILAELPSWEEQARANGWVKLPELPLLTENQLAEIAKAIPEGFTGRVGLAISKAERDLCQKTIDEANK